MVGGFHASDGYSVEMEPPSQIMLLDIEQSANVVHNEASRLLVNFTLLTNKRTISLSMALAMDFIWHRHRIMRKIQQNGVNEISQVSMTIIVWNSFSDNVKSVVSV